DSSNVSVLLNSTSFPGPLYIKAMSVTEGNSGTTRMNLNTANARIATTANATTADGQAGGTIIYDHKCVFGGNPPLDFDGDCKSDIGIFRNGQWLILRSSDLGQIPLGWGAAQDIPVPLDYDGDGKTDIAVYRAGNGAWFILRSSDGGQTTLG